MSINTFIHPKALPILENPFTSLAVATIDSSKIPLPTDHGCKAAFHNGEFQVYFPVPVEQGENLSVQPPPELDTGLGITKFLLHPLCLGCSRICTNCVLGMNGREYFALSGIPFQTIPENIPFLV